MDTSTKYIQMCNCPEIQKNRPYNPGDLFAKSPDHSFSDNFIYYIDDIPTPIRRLARHYVFDAGGIWKPFGNIPDDLFIWLPYQHELQSMISVHHPESDILSDFIACWEEESHSLILKFVSFEQLWLRFYMTKVHKKIWNIDEWIIQKAAPKCP